MTATRSPRRRWKATVSYRCTAGPVSVVHDLEELSHLHDLIERGPHWDTVISIVIERVEHVTSDELTVEEAARL